MQRPVIGLTVVGSLERQLQPLTVKASESWRYKMSKAEEKILAAGVEPEPSLLRHPRRGTMRGAVLYGPGDVRFEERTAPTILEPTDALLRISATCVCGSDLWPYRGIQPITGPTPMGHEYCGIVEEVGSAVRKIQPGQFVVGSFFASDNTCAICLAG